MERLPRKEVLLPFLAKSLKAPRSQPNHPVRAQAWLLHPLRTSSGPVTTDPLLLNGQPRQPLYKAPLHNNYFLRQMRQVRSLRRTPSPLRN
jgi:hypothetical protein